MWLGKTVKGKEHSREGKTGLHVVAYENETRGTKPHGTKWKETSRVRLVGGYDEVGLWVDMLELWLCVLLRMFLCLTCGFVYLRFFKCQSCGCRFEGLR